MFCERLIWKTLRTLRTSLRTLSKLLLKTQTTSQQLCQQVLRVKKELRNIERTEFILLKARLFT